MFIVTEYAALSKMDFESILFATNTCTQIDVAHFCIVFPQQRFIPKLSLFANTLHAHVFAYSEAG